MAALAPVQQATFRDPAGSVEIRPDGVFRSVRESYSTDMLAFLATPIAGQLTRSGQIVGSEVVQSGPEGLVLRHPRVWFASYPSEWPASLWLAAAELTLDMCEELIPRGWIIKDATPLNILFSGSKPIFVDILSIERKEPSQTVWLAYSQFVRTFLLPILAHAHLGWPLSLAQTRRDGIEPEQVYQALPWTRRFAPSALVPVSLPVIFDKFTSQRSHLRQTEPGPARPARTVTDPEVAEKVLLRQINSLRASMRRAMPSKQTSAWAEYVDTNTHYSGEEHTQKKQFVAETLRQCNPEFVLDVGCNTGVYSRLAADAGAQVVSIDTDPQALDRLYTELKGKDAPILPLCVDLAYPTPAVGWENRECPSFLERCTGRFDTVMLLAVIHHLLLSSQIPMEHIARLCSTITTRNIILEWVPPTDVKYLEVLRSRGSVYGHISEELLRASFGTYFDVAHELQLANGRILFHLIKR